MNRHDRKHNAGATFALKPCAICLLRLGFGKKAVTTLTGIPPSVVYRIKNYNHIKSIYRRKKLSIATMRAGHLKSGKINVTRMQPGYWKKNGLTSEKPKPLELWEFKGEGKQWSGFELFMEQKVVCSKESIRFIGTPVDGELRPIPGFERYACDANGNIVSLDFRRSGFAKNITPKPHGNGYVSVGLYANGKQYLKTIHRLIAMAWIPNPDGFNVVNHINGIRNDNRVENLEWCSYQYNALDGQRRKNVSRLP